MIFGNKKSMISNDSNKFSRAISPDDFDFRELFKANYPMVLRHATLITGDIAFAEDVAQETFIKLYERPPKEFTNLSGWLLKVATNIAYNNLRSEKSRKRREATEKPLVESFEQDTESMIDAERVKELMIELSDRDRICLILKFSGFSYDEIARMAGVNRNSVGKVIARALEKFKRIYEKEMA